MAMMFAHVYVALRSAGVSEERARLASEELAKTISNVGTLPATVADLKIGLGAMQKGMIGLQADVTALKADVAVLKWILGFVIAMVLTVLWKLFLGH